MMHADRHTVGHYRCTADNRVGQPDGRDIFVNVLCKYRSNKGINACTLIGANKKKTDKIKSSKCWIEKKLQYSNKRLKFELNVMYKIKLNVQWQLIFKFGRLFLALHKFH